MVSQPVLPTVIVMEGGYTMESIGANVAEFLEGCGEALGRDLEPIDQER